MKRLLFASVLCSLLLVGCTAPTAPPADTGADPAPVQTPAGDAGSDGAKEDAPSNAADQPPAPDADAQQAGTGAPGGADAGPVAEPEPEPATEPEPTPAAEPAPTPETVMLTVYAPDATAEGFVTTEVGVAAVDAETLAAQLAAAGVLGEGGAINTLAQSGSQVNVDFNAVFGDHVRAMGTSGEYLVIGSVVNTLLGAFGADSVLITVEGQPLETGHNVYDAPLSFYA